MTKTSAAKKRNKRRTFIHCGTKDKISPPSISQLFSKIYLYEWLVNMETYLKKMLISSSVLTLSFLPDRGIWRGTLSLIQEFKCLSIWIFHILYKSLYSMYINCLVVQSVFYILFVSQRIYFPSPIMSVSGSRNWSKTQVSKKLMFYINFFIQKQIHNVSFWIQMLFPRNWHFLTVSGYRNWCFVSISAFKNWSIISISG